MTKKMDPEVTGLVFGIVVPFAFGALALIVVGMLSGIGMPR